MALSARTPTSIRELMEQSAPGAASADPAPSRRLYVHAITIEPSVFLGRDHMRTLRAGNYLLRAVRAWHHVVEWIEQGNPDLLLLDLDAIDARVSAMNVSARRLVTLARKAAGDRPLLIAGTSARDYVEIEDTVLAGVDLLLRRDQSPVHVLHLLEARRARRAHETARVNALTG
jgi:hypothetical protein